MKNNIQFRQTYFLIDQRIKDYQKWSTIQIFEWLETTNEFLFQLRTAEAKSIANKIRKEIFK